MRLWSLNPSLLDAKGLVALWREGLLAKNVLEGKTKGYRNHPQLERFKKSSNPLEYINEYLYQVLLESQRRNYHFDSSKIRHTPRLPNLQVSEGQIEFEYNHLLVKLRKRNPEFCQQIQSIGPSLHPLFEMIEGGIESWEKV